MAPPVRETKAAPDWAEQRSRVGNAVSEIVTGAPFSDWQIDSSYDSARQCELARIALLKLDLTKKKPDGSFELLDSVQNSEAHCVGLQRP